MPILKATDPTGSGTLKVRGATQGTINYTTGVANIMPDAETMFPIPMTQWKTIGTTAIGSPLSGSLTTTKRKIISDVEYISTVALANEETIFTAKYKTSSAATTVTGEVHTVENLKLDLTPTYREFIVPNSTRFDYADTTFVENSGFLYHTVNHSTGAGTLAGTIDYSTGIASITDCPLDKTNAVAVKSLLTKISSQAIDSITFRSPGHPLQSGSLYIQANRVDVDPQDNGNRITGQGASDGTIDSDVMKGSVDYENGVIRIRFGTWEDIPADPKPDWYNVNNVDANKVWKQIYVYPESITFNCVVYSYVPLSASILGLDPTRLPFDGRVLIFKQGDFVVVHNTQDVACAPVVSGSTTTAGRVRLSRVEVRDVNNIIVDPLLYTENLDAGTILWDTPLDLSDYQQPLTLYHTVEDLAMAADVQVDGTLTLNQSLTHDYPADTSYLSSAMVLNNGGVNDLYARVSNSFSQQTWTTSNGSYWSDSRIGNEIIAKYAQTQHPIVVENSSCINERWALIFTSSTTFNIVGEFSGQIGTGTTNTDVEPINENTGRPYFKILAVGFGSGWSNGNVLRFSTLASNYPVWVARTIRQSQQSTIKDSFRLLVKGDTDS
jgi:hypothetical protein